MPTGVWVSVQRLIEAWYGGWRWRDWRTHRCRRGRVWSKPGPWVDVPGLSHPRQ